MDKDLLGNPTTEMEKELVGLYTGLKGLIERDDLTPCVAANAREALACLYQAVNDLNLVHETLYEHGV
jgi:hypothetical protein